MPCMCQYALCFRVLAACGQSDDRLCTTQMPPKKRAAAKASAAAVSPKKQKVTDEEEADVTQLITIEACKS